MDSGAKAPKKQFSLSILMRIFLIVLVVSSIGVFANSVMRYNAMMEEEAKLEELLNELKEIREELVSTIGTAEEVNRILSSKAEYDRLIAGGGGTGELLEELKEKKAEVEALLNESKYRDYIVKTAKEQLGLYFPDEKIYYSDNN